TVPSAGSSAPYTLVWFATVAVNAAGVIVRLRSAERRVGKEFGEGVVKLPAEIAYGEPTTFSPTARVRLVAVEVKPLSLIATLRFQVTTAGLVISPPRVTPTVPSAGSSAPYTLVWFATVAVNAAGVIVRLEPATSVGAL